MQEKLRTLLSKLQNLLDKIHLLAFTHDLKDNESLAKTTQEHGKEEINQVFMAFKALAEADGFRDKCLKYDPLNRFICNLKANLNTFVFSRNQRD